MAESEQDSLDKLEALLRDEKSVEVAAILSSQNAADAAELIRNLPLKLRDDALLTLAPETAADILEKLPDDLAAAAVLDMEPGPAAAIAQEMQSDDVVDLLQDVGPEHAEAILEHIDPEEAAVARQLLQYDEDSAGGLMQAEFIEVSETMTAGEAVHHLQEHAEEYAEYSASYLYAVDSSRKLSAVVSLRSLLLCGSATPISQIVSGEIISVVPEMDGSELVNLFRRHHYLAIPVVDESMQLLGIVTQDDAMRFAEESAEEDMLSMTGIVGGDEFREMPLRQRSWGRLSWLSVNILLNVLAASVIAFYQDTLRAVIALAVFLPIISDMSGCSGNQAVAVSIRELSLGRISPQKLLWVLGKEISVGLINGLVLGVLIGLIAWWWQANAMLGLVIGGALWINSIVAVSIGGIVPLLLRRFGHDPAIASGPILTTMTDMCGFFIVLGTANHFLHLLV
ncbi:MAG: magnesium transporter [Lentisphaeria bacterium]|nr:magnesium transporter [Lentisphaeria bacterium]